MQPLSETQVIAFLDHAPAERYFALYCLAVSTGVRQSEILGLTWADVDLELASLAVRQQLVYVPGNAIYE